MPLMQLPGSRLGLFGLVSRTLAAARATNLSVRGGKGSEHKEDRYYRKHIEETHYAES